MTSENPIVIVEGQDSQDVLMSMLCCTGDDHTISEGGQSMNLLQTKYLAEWKFLAFTNFEVPLSIDYPLASAIICGRCMHLHQENPDVKFVVAGDPGPGENTHYWRVPVSELVEPDIYWPDHHPDADQRYT